MNFERNLRSFSSSQRLRFTVTCNKEPWHHVQSGKTSSTSSVHPIRSSQTELQFVAEGRTRKFTTQSTPDRWGVSVHQPFVVDRRLVRRFVTDGQRQWSENEPKIRLSQRFSCHQCSRQQRDRPRGVRFTLPRPDSALGACFRGSINQISTQLLTCDNEPTNTQTTHQYSMQEFSQ